MCLLELRAVGDHAQCQLFMPSTTVLHACWVLSQRAHVNPITSLGIIYLSVLVVIVVVPPGPLVVSRTARARLAQQATSRTSMSNM